MNTKEKIKEELEKLVNDSDATYKHIIGDTADIAFTNNYQSWYTRAVKLVSLLGKDRLDEFYSYYLINPNRNGVNSSTYVIQDYVSGYVMPRPTMGSVRTGASFLQVPVVKSKFAAQIGIAKSLSSRIDSVLSDVEGHLLAELQDEELKVASQLVVINLRAAGAVAGVVLEAHLQRLVKNHAITIIDKNPAMSILNDTLKSNGVYDLAHWKKISYLATIRNYCDHPKEREPTEEEVKELIKETEHIIKTVS